MLTLPNTVTHIFQSQLYCILAFMFAFYRFLHMKFRTVIVVLSVSIYFMSHLSVLAIMFSVTHAYVSWTLELVEMEPSVVLCADKQLSTWLLPQVPQPCLCYRSKLNSDKNVLTYVGWFSISFCLLAIIHD